MEPLDEKERKLLDELSRIAGSNSTVTAQQLHKSGFPDFVAAVYASAAVFRQSLENRKLQILQAKGYIEMHRGTYTIIARP